MRFVATPGESDPVSSAFADALADAVYQGFRRTRLPHAQIRPLAEAILMEIRDTLAGSTRFPGRTGDIYAILMFAPSNPEQTEIPTDEEQKLFDRAQMDLLCHFIEIVDRRVVYLGLSETDMIEITTDIVWNICKIIDGGAPITASTGQILPILGFSLNLRGTGAITSARQSWMHEYVHGVIDEHFQR